jgi:hypothetical protein
MSIDADIAEKGHLWEDKLIFDYQFVMAFFKI